MAAASLKRPRVHIGPKKKAKKPSAFSRGLGAIPLQAATVQKIMTMFILSIATAALIALAAAFGIPAMLGTEAAEAVGRAGFAVKRVEVTGIDRMDRLTVYAIALDQKSRAMPSVDLEKVRARLLEYGWIADARVSRRLPDMLVVDIVERKPTAIWQHKRQLSLIDANGVVLEAVKLDAMPDLPLVIGPAANARAADLSRLLGYAPQLKPMLAAASWIGNRRWDLRFQSGELLALPEGEAAAARALLKFAEMDVADRLLGRGFVRFDMRDPQKMVVRMGKGRPSIDKPIGVNSEDGGDANGGGVA